MPVILGHDRVGVIEICCHSFTSIFTKQELNGNQQCRLYSIHGNQGRHKTRVKVPRYIGMIQRESTAKCSKGHKLTQHRGTVTNCKSDKVYVLH